MHLQLKKLLDIEAKVKENIVEKQLKINIPNIKKTMIGEKSIPPIGFIALLKGPKIGSENS